MVTPKKGVQIDAIDLKRLMMTVVIAMIPRLLFGIWNVGHQYYFATGADGSFIDKILVGSKQVLPVVLVSYVAGGLVEVVFSTIRRHPIKRFFITGMLIPLIMPQIFHYGKLPWQQYFHCNSKEVLKVQV